MVYLEYEGKAYYRKLDIRIFFKMSDNSPHDFLAKVIIVGDSGVGKTNLLTQFC